MDLPHLPPAFDGFTMLQLSDLHIDAAPDYAAVLIEAIRGLDYDVCVLTGDYRARTYGPFDAALAGLAALRPHLKGTPYAVLGNHDTLRMVPGMEAMGYRVLLNESIAITRGGAAIAVTGDFVDLRLDVLDAVIAALHQLHAPLGVFLVPGNHDYLENGPELLRRFDQAGLRLLLAHHPDAFDAACRHGFDLTLAGHTHGGQICLPGGRALLTASGPRRFARGAWQYHGMRGYTATGSGTSLVDVRLNCPPEVTVHCFRQHLPPAAG